MATYQSPPRYVPRHGSRYLPYATSAPGVGFRPKGLPSGYQGPTGPTGPGSSSLDRTGYTSNVYDPNTGQQQDVYAAPTAGPLGSSADTGGDDQEYDYRGDKIAAAQAQGFQAGEVPIGQAIATGLGLFTGIPGASWLAEKAFDLDDPNALRPGTVGTYDAATGDVYGYGAAGRQWGGPEGEEVVGGVIRGYDPITGRATDTYASPGGAWNTWNYGRQQLGNAGFDPVQSALGSWENSAHYISDAERQQGITPGSKAGVLAPRTDLTGDVYGYRSRSGKDFVGGIHEGAPGRGTTFSSGNLRTDDTGKVVEAAVPTIDPNTGIQTGGTHFQSDSDNDGGYTPSAAQVEAEKNVSLDAFGGSGDDGGGSGGGK